ncbi:MAG: uroporphyrinogen-III synthase [Actinobacteria bacterium]|nr:MAG: uroporphyrinogen-III synthase [Actinomycetota bacterium]
MTARGPLAGKVILVTRPRDQSTELVREIERRGATAIVAPTIELVPVRSAELTDALQELAAGAFAWITLTSRATVEVLASRLEPKDVQARVAAVGEGTAGAFRRWAGREPDLVPRTFTTAALAHAFPRGRGRVLCARADVAPQGLESALAAKGWTPLRVDAYRTKMPEWLPLGAREALARGTVDAITFTSASSVRGFANAASDVQGDPKIVCIGPVTAREARALGLEVASVAQPHTIDGLVAALEHALAGT